MHFIAQWCVRLHPREVPSQKIVICGIFSEEFPNRQDTSKSPCFKIRQQEHNVSSTLNVHLSYLWSHIMSCELHYGTVNGLHLCPPRQLPNNKAWKMTGCASLSGPFTGMMFCMWRGLFLWLEPAGEWSQSSTASKTHRQNFRILTFINAHTHSWTPIHAFMNAGANVKRTFLCILESAPRLLRLYFFNKSSLHCFALCRKRLQGVEVAH